VTLRELMSALWRRWWLVLLVPAVALPLLIVRARMQPYQTSFSAVVLLPGDTEIPGSSERPELMILDDLPSLISSTVYSDAVAADLASRNLSYHADDIHGSMNGTRYSRVLTVTVTRDSSTEAREIAESAANVLPAQVNQYLVADGAASSTVNVIDPPGDPTRTRPNQWIIIAALTLLAAGVGAGIALLADTWSRDYLSTNRSEPAA
jgi:capsular polysaccharide biosynthesis protein